MSLSIGIVGLPNVGKSTLFNALTKKSVSAENFPFCTIDPSVGVVAVPDFRLDRLAEFSQSEKKIPAAVEFVDIAGLVKGASEGEGLGNQFLSHIREVDAILHLVRIFEDEDIIHVNGFIEPASDIEVINLELILADLQTVEKRLSSIEKDLKRGDKEALKEKPVLDKVCEILKKNQLVSTSDFNEEEKYILKTLHLLTAKPMLFVLNKNSGGQNLDEIDDGRFKKLLDLINSMNAKYVSVDAGVEQELKDFDFSERSEFRKEMGGTPDGGVDELIKAGYRLLNLITYFTTGEKETRGWTIRANSTAPEAGYAIHSDFHDKFIKADVIFWEDLLNAGSHAKAREQGLIRTEGKQYIVKDGDVIEFKI